ncbi:MAG: hypothetical protein ACQESX_10570 [Bacteroidota bacterium]
MTKYLFFSIILASLILSSCDKDDNSQEIPSYIRIDSIMLNTNPGVAEGALSHNITDAWVYVNNRLVGAFELPAVFPVLEEGDVEIMIKAGIKMNGVSETRIPYPFYSDYKTSGVTLTPGETTLVEPSVAYDDNSIFPWKESFDNEEIRVKIEGDTTIQRIYGDEAFDNNGSGRIVLEDSATFFEITSDTGYVLPQNGEPSFLEMDFKTNRQITTGLYAENPASSNQNAIVVLNPTDEWKKIYINLTSRVLNTMNANTYRIFIGTTRNYDEEPLVFDFDNLKMVHY